MMDTPMGGGVEVGGVEVLADRYTLEELIGRGGMADVYRGRDRVLGRPVALKLLRDVTASESERARFAAEARTLARLNHPGLVTVLDAGTAGERPYLVMELVDGRSLAEHSGEAALEPGRVARTGSQVADALAYAHQTGIVHRDVKPGNVLLGVDGHARLTDFGIARLVGDAARYTRVGVTIGTAAYLSPEQVRGREVTPAADVYALGLTLLEALTGRRAYQGSPTEAAFARLSAPPVIPESLPPGWRSLLCAMTALEPTDRPTAERVCRALREMRPGNGTAVPGGVPGEPAGTRMLTGIQSVGHRGSGTPSTQVLVSGRGRWTRRVPQRLWIGAVLAGLAIVLVVVATTVAGSGGGADGRGSVVPRNVPARLEQPLQHLHDAISGAQR